MLKVAQQAHKVGHQAVSLPRLMLHIEGAAVFASVIVVFVTQGWGLVPFFLLLLTPDLGMIGYLANERLGSITYNVVHTYTLPLLLFGLAVLLNVLWPVHIGLIIAAHIGMDRMMGYGLKYPTNFKDTHLNRV